MSKGKERVGRIRLGLLLSYALVFCFGLWVGYELAQKGKSAGPEVEERVELGGRMDSGVQEKRSNMIAEDREGEHLGLEGDVIRKDDLSLTFYDTLLKKEPPSEVQKEGGESKAGSTASVEKRRESPIEEGKSSKAEPPRLAPFSIQVGSFAHKQQAEDLTQRLLEKGYPAYITSRIISGMGRMYQVRIGHYRTLEEAKREAKIIGRRENVPTYIPPVPGQ
jgi:cell division septation protein DedD